MATHFKGPIISATNVCKGLASTATAAGSTALNFNSPGIQVFTGTTTQTVLLPPAYSQNINGASDASLAPGLEIVIVNLSSGTVTVTDSASGAVGTIGAGTKKTAILLTNATVAGTWSLL